MYLDGIVNTAQNRINANGQLSVEDAHDLFNIAKLKDGNIDDAAVNELKLVYTTHYAKMNNEAIHGFEIFFSTHEFNNYMHKQGGNWSDWYVGLTTTETIENQLFTQHQVSKERGLWIYKSVTLPTTAQFIYENYIEKGTLGDVHGSGANALTVYAFKMSAVPQQENAFSKVVLDPQEENAFSKVVIDPQRNTYNPNRKVHDLDPQNYRQCGYCSGSGSQTCSSCGGTGGRSESRTDYDLDNNPIYRSEWVSCYSCSGGKQTCSTCGGSGTVNN